MARPRAAPPAPRPGPGWRTPCPCDRGAAALPRADTRSAGGRWGSRRARSASRGFPARRTGARRSRPARSRAVAGGAATPPTTRPGVPMRPTGRGRAEAGRERPTHHQHPITPQQTHTGISSLYARRLEDMGLKTLLTGGASELGQPDLLRKVVDGILKLRRHGGRGIEVLPEEVQVRIKVAEGRRAGHPDLPGGSLLRPRGGGVAPEPPGSRAGRPHAGAPLQRGGQRSHLGRSHGDPAPHAAVPRRRRRPRRVEDPGAPRAPRPPDRPRPVARRRPARRQRRHRGGQGQDHQPEGGAYPPRGRGPRDRVPRSAGGDGGREARRLQAPPRAVRLGPRPRPSRATPSSSPTAARRL